MTQRTEAESLVEASLAVPLLEEVAPATTWRRRGKPMPEHVEAGLNLAAECYQHGLAASLGFTGSRS